MLTNREIILAHRYRSTNPLDGAGRECKRNMLRCLAVLFGPGRDEAQRLFPGAAKGLKRKEVEAILIDAAAHYPEAAWPVPPERVLAEKVVEAPAEAAEAGEPKASNVERSTLNAVKQHPDYDYEPVLLEWAGRIGKQAAAPRFLEWGPGRSTQVLHVACPSAEILSIEHQQAFAEKARKDHPYARVIHAPLRDYGANDYPVWPLLHGEGPFDLIFVDGRRRAECLLTALEVLAPDGIVILHDAFRPHYAPAIRRLYEVVESAPTMPHDGPAATCEKGGTMSSGSTRLYRLNIDDPLLRGRLVRRMGRRRTCGKVLVADVQTDQHWFVDDADLELAPDPPKLAERRRAETDE